MKKRAQDPDCTKYLPDEATLRKRYWFRNDGQFKKCAKNTFIDVLSKFEKDKPGPGSNFQRPKGTLEDRTKHSPLGRFDKSEGADFISNCQFQGEETPGVGAYLPKAEDRDKVYQKYLPRSPAWKIYESKKTTSP